MSRRLVVMGVCGCGKSTVAALLAERLAVRYVDGDALHSDANIAKMSRGEPLDDADRLPWLATVGETLRDGGTVIACSALKRSYRALIEARAGAPVTFVYLHGERETLLERMVLRERHFMPASLLDSQLATIERPGEGECCVEADITLPIDCLVAGIATELNQEKQA